MLGRLADIVVKRYKLVLVLIMLATLFFAMFLPSISIQSDLTEFLPDSEPLRDQKKVEEYFGQDPYIHIVYVKAKQVYNEELREYEANVLSPAALREQYNLTQLIRGIGGVKQTQGLADVYNELVKYTITSGLSVKYNPNMTLANASDGKIEGWTNIIRQLFTGEVDLENFTGMENLPVDVDEIKFVFELLLTKDFRYDEENLTASGTLITVMLDGTLARFEARTLAGEMSETTAGREWLYIEESQTSEYLIAHEVEENLMGNIAILGAAIFVLTVLILWLTFRRASYIMAPILTLIIATIWTFGGTVAMGIKLTAIDIAVIPLIIGLGVDYSVHISRRYNEELRSGKGVGDAIHISITHVGEALVLAVLTTVVAFLSNLTSDVRPIGDFGVMCALGVFFAFFLTLTFHCAFRLLIDERTKKRAPQLIEGHGTPFIDRTMRAISGAVERAPVAIVALTVVLSLAGLYASTMVGTSFAIQEFLPSDWDSIQTQIAVGDDFHAGSYRYTYAIIEGDVATPEMLFEVDTIMNNSANDQHVVGSTTGQARQTMESPVTAIALAASRNSTLCARFNVTEDGLPTTNCTPSDVDGIFGYLRSNYTEANPITGYTYSYYINRSVHRGEEGWDLAVVRIPTSTTSQAENRVAIRELKGDMEGAAPNPVKLTGALLLEQYTIDRVQEGQISSTIVSVIFAIVILVIIYRSFTLGSIAIIPVVVSITLVLGTMYLAQIPLNILTVMVTALTVGLGIDYAIHVIERFREERAKMDIYPALESALEKTGGALFISAVTTIAGFGVLIFAQMPILQGFGIIASTMMVYSFLTAVAVLPVPLVLWAKFKKKRQKGSEG